MRPITLALLLALPAAAHADEPSWLRPEMARLEVEQGRSLRTTGIVVTALGIGMLGAATALFLHDCDFDQTCNGARYLFLADGLAATGGGVLLWHLGAREIGRALPFLAPVHGGAVAGVRLADF